MLQRCTQSEDGDLFASYSDSDGDECGDCDIECNECHKDKCFLYADDDEAYWPEKGEILDVRYWNARAEREGTKKDQYISKCLETQRRVESSTEKLLFSTNELKRHRASSAEHALLASNELQRELEASDARRVTECGVYRHVMDHAQNMIDARDKTIDARDTTVDELMEQRCDLQNELTENKKMTKTAFPERAARKRSRTN